MRNLYHDKLKLAGVPKQQLLKDKITRSEGVFLNKSGRSNIEYIEQNTPMRKHDMHPLIKFALNRKTGKRRPTEEV